MAIRLDYDTTTYPLFKWDLAHWRRHDNDIFTTGRYDTMTTQHCVLSPSRKHIATEGGNPTNFKDAVLVNAFGTEEERA